MDAFEISKAKLEGKCSSVWISSSEIFFFYFAPKKDQSGKYKHTSHTAILTYFLRFPMHLCVSINYVGIYST